MNLNNSIIRYILSPYRRHDGPEINNNQGVVVVPGKKIINPFLFYISLDKSIIFDKFW